MPKEGKDTSEHKGFNFVKVLSLVLPLVALLCDLLVNQSVVNGTAAVVAGLIASSIASAGYSTSRGKVKASDAIAERLADAAKKKNPASSGGSASKTFGI